MELSLSDLGWQAHPEVWVLIVGLVGLAFYVARVVQPKAVTAGFDPISRSQKIWFLLAAAGLWAASDWPVHDVAEEYLYFVHMFQHMFISMLVPAMFLLATPRWLFELLVPEGGRTYRFLATGSKPLVAGIVFNVLTMVLHWAQLVQWSFESGPLHFGLHLLIFASGLLMWMPVIGPVEAWRLPPIGQCIYLFAMSIMPTVPGGWLVFAEDVVYRHYDTTDRLFGVNVLTDQQMAGVVMKLVGGFFLWAVIVAIFGRWAAKEAEIDEAARKARRRPVPSATEAPTLDLDPSLDEATGRALGEALTFEQVADEFSKTTAPTEPTGS